MHVQESDYEELAGNPDHLLTMANHYMGIADRIRKSVPFLHSLAEGDGQKSKATDALKDTAKKVADDIDKAESRYRVTAQALIDYVPFQRQAKDDAHTAVLKIKEAESDVTSTGKTLHDADDANDKAKSSDTAADSDKDAAKTAADKAKTASEDAKKDLAHWQGKWREARDYRNHHAHDARNKINDLIKNHNNGLKNPEHHWYDGIVHIAKAVWHAVEGPLKFICKWAGVLSIFLSWVPVLGEVLLVLAVIGAAITLIEDIASGKGWKTLLGDSIGLVLTAFGGSIGKYFGKLAKFKTVTKAEGALAKLGGKNPAFLKSGAFKAEFGFTKTEFGAALKNGKLKDLGIDLKAKDITNLKIGGIKGFLRDVRNPLKYDFSIGFKENLAKFPSELAKFKANPLGLTTKDLGFGTFKGLDLGAKLPMLVADGRKLAGTGQTLFNTGNDLIHGDWQLKGDQNPQVYLKPESIYSDLVKGK